MRPCFLLEAVFFLLELNQSSVEAALGEETALLLQELNQPSVDAAPPVYCEAALWEDALSRALSRALSH